MKNKEEQANEPWPEGLPRPYQEGRIIPLQKFLHGEEIIARQERNRVIRRKQIEELLGLEKDDY